MKVNNEKTRISALERYAIMDTPPEEVYDDITRLAADVCDTPIALITLLDESRQWFKSRVGLDVEQTPRDIAFCDHAIREEVLFEVKNAQLDERFVNNPLVTDAPNIRFYAGVPLTTTDGCNLGTLCVIDRQPRELTSEQQSALGALARQVMLQLELRRSLVEKEEVLSRLSEEIKRRKALQEAQHQAELFMRETLDSLSDHIAIINDKGTIVYVNQAWDDFAHNNSTIFSRSALSQGANYLDVCDRATLEGNAEAEKVAAALRSALIGQLEPGFELEYPCHAPWKKRWFVSRISAFQDTNGHYAVISHHNITVRYMAEHKVRTLNESLEKRVKSRTEELAQAYHSLRTSEENFRTIFEDAATAFATTKPDGYLQKFNLAFQKLTGCDEIALAEKNINELIHSEDLHTFSKLQHQLKADAIPGFVKELRFVRSDGECIWVNTSMSAIRDTKGQIVQTMALLQNIDSRRQAEYERDQFFELSVDMFVILDFDGYIQRINPACTRILGYDQAELTGKLYYELFHPDDRKPSQQVLTRLVKVDTSEDINPVPYVEARIRTKGGDYRIVRWSAAPWKDARRVIAVGRDITQIRDNENNLRALANQLRSIREEERTRISREIHDELGQMLTALKMDLSLYARDVSALSQDQKYPDSSEELQSMIELVDEILKSVRRIAQELRPEVLDALGLVSAVRWQAAELQERTGLTIELDTDHESPALEARQSTELFRIIQEALTNVIRHAYATKASILMAHSDDSFKVQIADNGCGYKPETVSSPSLGVLGMRERAATIGASFNIEGKKDNGTILKIVLPLSGPGKGDTV